jgi:hypothetical protein
MNVLGTGTLRKAVGHKNMVYSDMRNFLAWKIK